MYKYKTLKYNIINWGYEELDQDLNNYASEGWRVIKVTTSINGSFFMPSTEFVYFLLEKNI